MGEQVAAGTLFKRSGFTRRLAEPDGRKRPTHHENCISKIEDIESTYQDFFNFIRQKFLVIREIMLLEMKFVTAATLRGR